MSPNKKKKNGISRKVLSFLLAFCLIVTDITPVALAATTAGNEPPASSSSTVVAGPMEDVHVKDDILPPLEENSGTTDDSAANSSTPPKEDGAPVETEPEVKPETPSEEKPAEPDTPPTVTPSPSPDGDGNSQPQEPEETPNPTEPGKPAEPGTEKPVSPEETAKPEDSESAENEEDANTPAEEENDEKTDFESLIIVAPESTEYAAKIGEQVTLEANLNRDDVLVSYQWQRFQKESPGVRSETEVYDYDDGKSTTLYAFPWSDMSEREFLEEKPDAAWPGIELYLATVEALEQAGEDASNVHIAWQTRNFALDGYAISAARVDDILEVYAEKDGERFTAHLNEEGEWAFDGETQAVTYVWEDIPDATESTFTFEVKEDDFAAQYRCAVTVLDEEYKAKCVELLAEGDVTLTEEQLTEEQVLYTPVISVQNPEAYINEKMAPSGFVTMYATLGGGNTAGNPKLSEDAQWIEGLTGAYEYITKDTYDHLTEWIDATSSTDERIRRKKLAAGMWSYLAPQGAGADYNAPKLDKNGYPTEEKRLVQGFDLVDGHMLPVNSNWYGQTVYFRVSSSKNDWTDVGTAVKIPAYTSVTVDADGNYTETASGTYYKKVIDILNPYVIDTGAKYQQWIDAVSSDGDGKFGSGWLLDGWSDGKQKLPTDKYIRVSAVTCEDFNKDPDRYMRDAEGNFRVDSVAWGVCTGEEPDISGKAYWTLKEYLAQGYGFMSGHDTMYAYAGSYYDVFGTDLDESTIDPNDGDTWYYDINSWMPGTTATNQDGEKSAARGGHFYMNQLVGSNAGNAYSGNITPKDSVSGILSMGGSNGVYGKGGMYGNDNLKVLQTGWSHEQAANDRTPKYRTPTNYPFKFTKDELVPVKLTHTNSQVAFGPIWIEYNPDVGNYVGTILGGSNEPTIFKIGDKYGTNNFYLTGTGNYLMNQIGHLKENSATVGEAKVLANSMYYISQRKQCEICAANQNGQETTHFVHRVNSANADSVLTALRNGGSFWYPLDDCYQLTDDIVLPENWTPIENFSGHWNSDVYEVKLNSKGTPLLANHEAPVGKYNSGRSNGWNLGDNKVCRIENVFKLDGSGTRTTGVARVLGDLNTLFGTENVNYAGYTVKFLGEDNPGMLDPGMEIGCTVNTDSKYVISNLPCMFEKDTFSNVLKARVYRPDGTEIVEYGSIRANVPTDFWDNDMTTPLYLGGFSAFPMENEDVYEGMKAAYKAVTTADEPITFEGWEYRENKNSSWKKIPADWDYSVVNEKDYKTNIGDYCMEKTLVLNNCDPAWNGYEFKATFSTDHHGTWNSYEYWQKNAVAYSQPVDGATHKDVYKPYARGELLVRKWPAKAQQGADQTVFEGDNATFTSTGFALADGGKISADWEFGYVEWDPSVGDYVPNWQPVAGSNEFGGMEQIVTNTPVKVTNNHSVNTAISNGDWKDQGDFYGRAPFYEVSTSITVKQVDIMQDNIHFRVHYRAVSPHGTVSDWYSNIGDEVDYAWTTETGGFFDAPQPHEKFSNVLKVNPPALEVKTQPASKYPDSAVHEDVITPDIYGQTLLMKGVVNEVEGPAIYRALIYYHPSQLKPDVKWTYRTMRDSDVKDWDQNTANALFPGRNIQVSISNRDLGVAGPESPYPGYYIIESTMAIKNAPVDMYSSETFTKYFFRCFATTNYATTKDPHKVIRKADEWGGLTMDHDLDIQHQGVFGYFNTNILTPSANPNQSSTVHSLSEVSAVTRGSGYTNWKYPRLVISVPRDSNGTPAKKINTAIVKFDPEISFNSNDYISFDRGWCNANGITVSQESKHEVIFVSTTKDAVALETWEDLLRNHVSFTSYDYVNYANMENGQNGVSGGALIKWHIDELRLVGNISTGDGKAYEVRDAGRDITWDEAKRLAESFNENYQTNGKLIEISSYAENQKIKGMIGGSNAWIGGYNQHWYSSGRPVNAAGITGVNGNGAYLAMNGNGSWSWYNSEKSVNFDVNVHGSVSDGHNAAVKWNQSIGTLNVPSNLVNDVTWYSVRGRTYDVKDPTNRGNEGDCFWYIEGQDKDHRPFKTAGMGEWGRVFYGTSGDSYTSSGNVGNGLSNVTMYIGNGATAISYGFSGTMDNFHIKGYREGRPDVNKYVVEYDLSALNMALTSHSAQDKDRIGTDVPPPASKKKLTAIISGNEKVYDGKPITPASFTIGGEGAKPEFFQIEYKLKVPNNYTGYAARTVSGANWTETGAVNAATYTATVSLTKEAVNAGWQLDEVHSNLTCELKISQRPVDVISTDNNRVYNGTSDGTIHNIRTKSAEGDRGMIAGDVVNLNTDTVQGYYTSDGVTKTIHNSVTNSATGIWTMKRDKLASPLKIVHDATSDPHRNYYLDKEEFSGRIAQRPVVVHSRYLDDPNDPRNVKFYDGTTAATVTDILIDNVLTGDNIGVKDPTVSGTYETAEAGETLGPDGRPQDDRLKKLQEYDITVDTAAELTGNGFGDYFIEREEYTGAIARATLEARVSSWNGIYGTGLNEKPWHDTVPYKAGTPATKGCWLNIDGLVKGDELLLDYAKSNFEVLGVEDPHMTITPSTPVGEYDLTYVGLNEVNYSLLSNYLVFMLNGSLTVNPREIIATVEDSDKMVNTENPLFHTTFLMRADDGTTVKVGSDKDTAYDQMFLAGDPKDTIYSTLEVASGRVDSSGGVSVTPLEMTDGKSNIPYVTDCTTDSKVLYLNPEVDASTHKCEFCENHFGCTIGTDHWALSGYNVNINLNPDKGPYLNVRTVTNPKGEEVQNYKLITLPGLLRVHPELRFNLKATVPMSVCMYGYRGDGEVVEPTNYGITNYSNGAIEITDIDVSMDGWKIIRNDNKPTRPGEMTMKMKDTSLQNGHNTPANRHNWIIARGNKDTGEGTFMHIPMECYIAGGNVNEAGCTFTGNVQYTIAEYGLTLPTDIVDGDLPLFVDGKPVNPDSADDGVTLP